MGGIEIAGSRRCWANVQTHLESTEQVKDPRHSEEILCGLEKTKPPPSSRTVPGLGRVQIWAVLLRDAAAAGEAEESPLGLTQASNFRCEVKCLYRDGKS